MAARVIKDPWPPGARRWVRTHYGQRGRYWEVIPPSEQVWIVDRRGRNMSYGLNPEILQGQTYRYVEVIAPRLRMPDGI